MGRAVMNPGWEAWLNARAAVSVDRVTSAIARDVRGSIARAHGVGPLHRSVDEDTTLLPEGRVSIGTDHWRYIEYGTPAHVITPDEKRALSWPSASHPVTRVRHPGTRAYAHMRRALYKKRRL